MSEGRVERRLAAILAADVVGYSRLMGQDEAGTLARLRELRRDLIDPRIGDHKGRVVKTTGDGILIEFPSVVEAVACAAAVQREVAQHNVSIPQDQRLEFRVGINSGDVIVEGDDIHGDGVNVAARLEALAEPGGICVSGIVHDQVQGRLEVGFEDTGEQSLKNIARSVRVYRVRFGAAVPPVTTPVPTTTALALPDKPSITVLPFAIMSSDPEQEFLADGIAEDVITALSRYPSLFVIARNSTFTYKGRSVEIRQVGRELGVRYVLEGSLRKAGNRIRVTAKLVEAESGNHVWADHYDRDLADIFAVQDEISEAVTVTIAPAIDQAERQRALRKPPENLDGWAAYQCGLWHFGKGDAEDNEASQRFFQRSIDLDKNFAGGYVGVALAQIHSAITFARRSLAEIQPAAERLAIQAVALDPVNADARVCRSVTLSLRGDQAGALSEADEAVALCPNLASAHGRKGRELIYSGHPKDGLEALRIALRLDPRSPTRWNDLMAIVSAHYH